MREILLRFLVALVLLMLCLLAPILLPLRGFATWLCTLLDAIQLELLLVSAERRTRRERRAP